MVRGPLVGTDFPHSFPTVNLMHSILKMIPSTFELKWLLPSHRNLGWHALLKITAWGLHSLKYTHAVIVVHSLLCSYISWVHVYCTDEVNAFSMLPSLENLVCLCCAEVKCSYSARLCSKLSLLSLYHWLCNIHQWCIEIWPGPTTFLTYSIV